MIFDFNKNFKSNVQVISNDFIKRSLPRIKNNKKVKLEDIEFNKMFKIYSEIEQDIIKDIKLITDFVNELNLDNDLFKKEA